MDRNWIHNPDRTSAEYLAGVEEFVRVASNHVNHRGHSECPCQKCNNCSWRPVSETRQHVIMYGMSYNYTKWNRHGERLGAASGKKKCWTYNAAKAQHDEMLVKEHEYLVEKAKEQQLPEYIPLEEIHVDDPEARIKIMMSVLGTKPGRQIRGLGDGRLRDVHTSSNVHNLENELEIERAARNVADVARMKMEQMMQYKMKVVEQQFNSTLQSWHHSMHQLCGKVPGFVVPPFTPLSIENNAGEEDDIIDDEENNFGDDQPLLIHGDEELFL